MAYETGSYSTLEQFITALKVFSEAHGWTTDEFSDFRGGKRLSHHNSDGIYLHWYSANNIQVNIAYRYTNASYTGPYVNRIVLHAGTGYQAGIHPAWQPGVDLASIDNYYSTTSSRQIVTTGQIPVYGTYHFLALNNYLAFFIDTGQQTLEYFLICKISSISGGDASCIITASRGASTSASDTINHPFRQCNTSYSYFYDTDSAFILSSGQFTKKHANAENFWIAQCNSPNVTSQSTQKDFSSCMRQTRPSGVNGVNPLVPVLLLKRVNGIFRPVGVVENIAIVNAELYSNMQEIQTTSGTWRIAKLTTDGSRDIAIRSDL